jgi:hypothetical protein
MARFSDVSVEERGMKTRTVTFPIALAAAVSLLAPEVNGQAEVTTVAALNVFFQGANGELIDAHWDGGDWFWGAHGLPPDGTRMDSAPAVLSVQSESNWWVLNVFFKGSNGQLVERDWEAMPGRWSWAAPHGLPPDGTHMDSAPAAIAWATTAYIVRNVYFKGADGQLYERWQQQGQPWQWFAHGLPPGGTLMASAPAALHWQTQDGTHQQDVFFQGNNGQLIEAYWDSSGWQWITDHGPPPGTQMASAPAAISSKTSAGVPVRHVFFAGADGQLYERWAAMAVVCPRPAAGRDADRFGASGRSLELQGYPTKERLLPRIQRPGGWPILGRASGVAVGWPQCSARLAPWGHADGVCPSSHWLLVTCRLLVAKRLLPGSQRSADRGLLG